MKTKTLTLLLLFASAFSFAQTIRRVNNNGVTGTNIYATIQDAHDDAVDGDIIYVEPSSVSYGDLKCVKQLTIYGNGYFLDKTKLSVNEYPSTLGNIEMNPGSASSILSGLSFGTLYIASSNVRVERNQTSQIAIGATYTNPSTNVTTYAGVSGILILQNFSSSGIRIIGTSTGSGTSLVSYTCSNIIVANNFFRSTDTGGDLYTNYSINTNDKALSLTIKNNVFYNYDNYNKDVVLNNTVFENNICIDVNYFGAVNSTVNNNVTNTTGLFTIGTGNQNSIVFANEFVVPPTFSTPSTESEDSRWKLAATSTLKTAGTAGTEVGIYGGDFPYIISGLPSIPNIQLYNTSTVGSTSTPLSVTISTKSNN